MSSLTKSQPKPSRRLATNLCEENLAPSSLAPSSPKSSRRVSCRQGQASSRVRSRPPSPARATSLIASSPLCEALAWWRVPLPLLREGCKDHTPHRMRVDVVRVPSAPGLWGQRRCELARTLCLSEQLPQAAPIHTAAKHWTWRRRGRVEYGALMAVNILAGWVCLVIAIAVSPLVVCVPDGQSRTSLMLLHIGVLRVHFYVCWAKDRFLYIRTYILTMNQNSKYGNTRVTTVYRVSALEKPDAFFATVVRLAWSPTISQCVEHCPRARKTSPKRKSKAPCKGQSPYRVT